MNRENRPFAFDRASFLYEPYPVGLIKDVFDGAYYEQLVSSFPKLDIFQFMKHHGDKYSLSELNNASQYHAFLERTPSWKRLYDYVKGPSFIPDVLRLLLQHEIDLNIPQEAYLPPSIHLRIKRLLLKVLGGRGKSLTSRFEFSAMPASGGNILPHTDSPQKLITLVVSMREPTGWESSYGGNTDVMCPADPSKSFNFVNRYLGFDDVRVIRQMPFDANQCVIFVKTFNSLHGVRPMTGPLGVFRRTLTINIESTIAW